MVSIMRPEQTLRLIQLYHASYPEIARNNQDADGRNQKLQMWANITEELNNQFSTLFTVEQYKKKVQNVQCTSRQKLFSGKRNLGEAEVEYLRLFEADKISEETLFQRAKSRSNADCLSLPPDEFELNKMSSCEPTEEIESIGTSDGVGNLKIRLNESKMMLKEWNEETTTNEQRENDIATILVRDDEENNFNNNLIKTTNNNNHQQLESAQQFLLALLNATLDNIDNNNITIVEESAIDKFAPFDTLKKKRKLPLENNQKGGVNGNNNNKRSRKLEKPIRTNIIEENVFDNVKTLMKEEGNRQNMITSTPTNNNNSKNCQNFSSPTYSNQTQIEDQIFPNNNNLFEQLCFKIDKTNNLLGKIVELISERFPKNNEEK